VNTRIHKQDSLVIVYDADRIEQPGIQLFDPDHWRRQGRLVGEAEGRGSALLLDTPFGPAVLRRYLRGGQAARISQDRYLFTGFVRSRPLAEFHMLAELSQAGLPVPQPLAAICRRSGLFYTGWLMTRRIMDVFPLAELLAKRDQDLGMWQKTGCCVKRFHDYGVVHADLNARNILVGAADEIHLIDFDRARISSNDASAFSANLKRLRRSLEKLWPERTRNRLDPCWSSLMAAYGERVERP
jgi:3-deoxy-D-manno-octulosonic acid kinase